MDTSTRWLRISYWVGAVADCVVGLIMFSEVVLGRPSPLSHYVPDTPYRYAIGLAGSLMLGWTGLLLWADRKPIERRAVLPLTCFVIIGLMTTGVFAISAKHILLPAGLALLAFQGLLIALFASSYVASRRRHPP